MKRAVIACFVASILLCLFVSGCSGGYGVASTKSERGGSLMSEEQTSSASTGSNKQEIDAFLKQMTNCISESSRLAGEALNAVESDDSEGCIKADSQVGKLYDVVYDITNVPAGAELCHGYVLEALLYTRACTSSYVTAALSEDAAERSRLISEGASAMSDATEATKKYQDEMTKLYPNATSE